jgi:hypothetical protein
MSKLFHSPKNDEVESNVRGFYFSMKAESQPFDHSKVNFFNHHDDAI